MPLGLCNTQGTFQCLMKQLFGDQQHQSVLLYLDNNIVYSSSVQHHLQRLRMMLGCLRATGLKVKFFAFFRVEVRYLGRVISSQGVATDPGKVEAIAQWPYPKTVSELRTFLGFVSYYRQFKEGFGQIAAPVLTEAGRGKVSSRRQELVALWSEQCEQAFRTLKQKITTVPVLAYADFKLPFILEIDASHVGLGAVLSQEVDGKVRPVAYASRSLRPVDHYTATYSSMRLEFLALKWAMAEKFCEYLLGHCCIVHTDNNLLTWPLQNWAPQKGLSFRWWRRSTAAGAACCVTA